MSRRIGTWDELSGKRKIKLQEGLSKQECAEEIGQFLAAVSNKYEPMNLEKLPSYLPSLPPPQVEQFEVYQKLLGLNNTKSTLPSDIPAKLRKEVSVELAVPLTHVINSCLAHGVYPDQWKREWVSPIPKVKEPQVLKDVLKVASTSDYNKVVEAFTKSFIIQDIGHKLDPNYFGGKKGHGTEHMVVFLMDRVLSLLDNNNTRSPVIKAGMDWLSAIERGDQTETAAKFVKLCLRPSIVKLLTEDLIEIYTLFIRNRAEYLSVVWHRQLTAQQTNKIENIQRTSLKIILGDNYFDYPAALAMTPLEKLSLRRQSRSFAFTKNSFKSWLEMEMHCSHRTKNMVRM